MNFSRSVSLRQEVYSKRMVSLGSVDKVVSVGDLRFEVHSQSRTFLFRAESTRAYLSICFFPNLAECLLHIFALRSGYESFTCIFIVCVFSPQWKEMTGCVVLKRF